MNERVYYYYVHTLHLFHLLAPTRILDVVPPREGGLRQQNYKIYETGKHVLVREN